MTKRQALLDGNLEFRNLLESEGLFCNASALAYFCCWLTPQGAPFRFHTRFYLALLPPNQLPLPDTREVKESLWLEPEHALTLLEEGHLPMVFPTFACLRTLANFDSLDRLCRTYGLCRTDETKR